MSKQSKIWFCFWKETKWDRNGEKPKQRRTEQEKRNEDNSCKRSKI